MQPSIPTPPDPVKTAAAQTQLNKDTATTQYQLNATNQYTPQGSLTYNQNGTWANGDPRYDATTSLSAPEQKIFDTGQATRQNVADIGATQSQKIGQQLNTPFNMDAGRGKQLADINRTFMDPQFQRQGDALRTQLINSGVRPGSAAYTRAMQDFDTNRQRGYDQMYLDSYGQANQAALTERNQPINEISALMSGSQVSQPNFQHTPTPGVAPTDYTGAVNANYAGQMQGYQAQVAQNNAMMNGLFGLAGNGVKAAGMFGGWGA